MKIPNMGPLQPIVKPTRPPWGRTCATSSGAGACIWARASCSTSGSAPFFPELQPPRRRPAANAVPSEGLHQGSRAKDCIRGCMISYSVSLLFSSASSDWIELLGFSIWDMRPALP
ncbi:hypothetical protein PAHAL_4G059100 [Panicum hallii]|uniref:Uncharacterized protein n=1 Tax=Panicum hallii TaxID=206008 RepID=A0A2T8JBY9_9POAL|nr:hypothetical protein PAHAL_4G059100 [Panicum hallii]